MPEPSETGPPSAAELTCAVLDCVRAIPVGQVMTYGDVAEYVGWRGPRWVGRVLAETGETVPWHRVIKATGHCAEHVRVEQLRRLQAEQVPIHDGRVDLRRARWDGRPLG